MNTLIGEMSISKFKGRIVGRHYSFSGGRSGRGHAKGHNRPETI